MEYDLKTLSVNVIERRSITWENGVQCIYKLQDSKLVDYSFKKNEITYDICVTDKTFIKNKEKRNFNIENSSDFNITSVTDIHNFKDFDSLYRIDNCGFLLNVDDNFVLERSIGGILYLEFLFDEDICKEKIQQIEKLEGIKFITCKVVDSSAVYDMHGIETWIVEIEFLFLDQSLAEKFKHLSYKNRNSGDDTIEEFIESLLGDLS